MDQSANQPTAKPVKSSAKKVLLVEDDDYLADVYKTRLTTEGFNVKRVADGEKALDMAKDFQPDLILLDIMMPKISGYDVLDILRNTPETAEIKIIMVTALGQESERKRASALGADDYLVKSQVIIADLVEKVKQHLEL